MNSPFSGYTKVTLVTGQPYSIEFGNNVYGLGYAGPQTDPVTGEITYPFSVVPQGIVGTQTYDAVVGADFQGLGLEIKAEVHSDYLVLYIKSTVP